MIMMASADWMVDEPACGFDDRGTGDYLAGAEPEPVGQVRRDAAGPASFGGVSGDQPERWAGGVSGRGCPAPVRGEPGAAEGTEAGGLGAAARRGERRLGAAVVAEAGQQETARGPSQRREHARVPRDGVRV